MCREIPWDLSNQFESRYLVQNSYQIFDAQRSFEENVCIQHWLRKAGFWDIWSYSDDQIRVSFKNATALDPYNKSARDHGNVSSITGPSWENHRLFS